MARANYGDITHLQERWKNEPGIPGWKKSGMIALVDKLKRKFADNHDETSGVELYFPEDCNNYDVFITVAYALDALAVPTSSGYIMREFGEYKEDA